MVSTCIAPYSTHLSYSQIGDDDKAPQRQNVHVNVFTCDGVYGSFLRANKYTPDKLTAIRDWIDKTLEKVPQEYRDTAVMKIDSVGGYEGEHHAEIEVYYERPETDRELEKRRKEWQRRKEEREATERKTLADLQRKYST